MFVNVGGIGYGQIPWSYLSVTGTWSGYQGAPFVLVGWQVRVFGSSGIVDRHMTVFPYVIFLFLGAWNDAPVIPPSLLNNDCSFGRNPVGVIIP